jgi:acetoacetyl-CoA synthetase
MYAGKVMDLQSKISAVVKDLNERGLRCTILLPSAITGKEIEMTGVSNT